jgi:hypothetical protein
LISLAAPRLREETNMRRPPGQRLRAARRLLLELAFVFATLTLLGATALASSTPTPAERVQQKQQDAISTPSSSGESESGGWSLWKDGVKNSEWGGHLKLKGFLAWPEDNSFLKGSSLNPLFDGTAELRLKDKNQWTNWLYTDVQYQLVLAGGDTRRRMRRAEWYTPDLYSCSTPIPTSDRRRLMNLTWPITKNDSLILYNRFDRVAATIVGDNAMLRIGRQGLGWGQGRLFNVFDLFNPFSPLDVERNYKVGDDIAYLQSTIDGVGELELAYNPRRDIDTREVEFDQSTLAGKFRLEADGANLNVLAATHYGDKVVGLGLGKKTRPDLPFDMRASAQGLLWNIEATWTFLDHPSSPHNPLSENSLDSYVSVVANLGYEWIGWNRPFKAYAEFYYNGLCNSHYGAELIEPVIQNRLNRGDLYTLGKYYISGTIESEVVQGVRIALTSLNNAEDGSGMLQPRVTWTPDQHVELVLGTNISHGDSDTEFGGYRLKATNIYDKKPDSVYCWLTYRF